MNNLPHIPPFFSILFNCFVWLVTASKVIQRYPGGHPAKEEEHLHECVYILSKKTIKKTCWKRVLGSATQNSFFFPFLPSWLAPGCSAKVRWKTRGVIYYSFLLCRQFIVYSLLIFWYKLHDLRARMLMKVSIPIRLLHTKSLARLRWEQQQQQPIPWPSGKE